MRLMRWYWTITAELRLRKAVDLAEKMHAANGARYYVLPNGNTSGKLIVTDRRNFRRLRAKGYIGREMRINDAARICFYATADGSGRPLFDEKETAARRRKFAAWFILSKEMGKMTEKGKKAGKSDK